MRKTLLANPAKKTRVAIIGYTASRNRAPFDESDWEIWGLNDLYQQIPRYDRWFELHKREVNLGDEGTEHIWRLAAMTCPVYMQRHYDDIPQSIPFPLQQVTEQFRPYLTSSFSFMAALAILEGFQEIGVFGVDVADEEWGSQRPSLEYFLGWAEGHGIKVTIPKESSLLRAPFVYGYQEREEQEFFGKLLNRERDYEKKLKRIQREQSDAAASASFYAGAISMLKQLRSEWRLPFSIEQEPLGRVDYDNWGSDISP